MPEPRATKGVGHPRAPAQVGRDAGASGSAAHGIFKVEAEVSGKPSDERMRVRQERAAPMLDELKSWMNNTLAQVSAKSPMALAIGYSLSNWAAMVRFVDDGRIEAHNNVAGRALGGVAIGRKKTAPGLRR
jgi:hypothetical protein